MEMKGNRFFGWLAAGALALALSGPFSGSAHAIGQRQAGQEDKSADAQAMQQSVGKQMLLAVVSTAPMTAANMPAAAVAAPPAMAPASFNWTGFYVGGNVGHGKGSADMTVFPLPSPQTFINLAPTQLKPDPSGIIGGIQGGFNLQRGRVVLGAEADYFTTNMNGTVTVSPIIQNNGTPFPGTGNNITSHEDTDWVGTLRGRVGLTVVPRLLVYGTGGLAYGHVTYFASTDFRPVGTEVYPAFADKTKTGWTAGTGAEFGIMKHFTARFEYLFYDLGNEVITAQPSPPLPPFQIRYNWETSANLVRAAFNFKF